MPTDTEVVPLPAPRARDPRGPRPPGDLRSRLAGALEGLTESQRAAAEHMDGPLLVLAGPGSGKTRVITRRIAHLIGSGIPAWQILALTFTNKAAAEMRERVDRFLGIEPDHGAQPDGRRSTPAITRGLTITTFHSLCARLLRKYAEIAKPQLGGLTPQFAIYDSSDQVALVKKAIEQLNLSTANWPARSVLSAISNAKNELIDAEAYTAQANDFSSRNVAKIYTIYQRLLRAANAVDFDDLLVLTARMLRENAEVNAACRERWQYLLIDEYQDTNRAQFVIASMLAGVGKVNGETAAISAGPHNICVVGDPDQSIYGWRGADITNILQFEKVFPKAKVIPLGENFRSTAKIIKAADALIRNNAQRKHKDLYTSNPAGESIRVVLCKDEHHEARLVADFFESLKRSDQGGRTSDAPAAPLAWKDFAVFYRTNALSRVMEDELRNRGVPYVIARGTAFYEREEVKNALAYLRVVANPADDVSLERIVNTPARGVGDTSLEKIQQWGAQHAPPLTLMDSLRDGAAHAGVTQRAQNAVQKFVAMIDEWRGEADVEQPELLAGTLAGTSLASLVERVIRESGLEAMYRAGRTEEDEERVENLAELVSSAREFEDNYVAEEDAALDYEIGAADPDDQPPYSGDDADSRSSPTTHPTSEPATRDPQPATPDDDDPLFIRALAQPSVHDMLRAYLERVTLVSDADKVDPAQGAVTLMTLHAAKGLEFPVVAVIGLEEGCLPHSRVIEDTSGSELEEERRLCFVGITRAMRRLMLSSAKYRTIRGVPERTMPSRFLEELPRDVLDVQDESGWSEPGWDEGEASRDGANFEWGKSSYEATRPRSMSSSSAGGGGGTSKATAGLGAVRAGSLVKHPQFGIGRVVSVTPGASARAQIQFRDAGTKTLVLEYARLEVLPG